MHQRSRRLQYSYWYVAILGLSTIESQGEYSSNVRLFRSKGECFEGVAIAKQHFTSVPDELINALIKKGAIFTCAGGFTVEDMTEYCGYVRFFPLSLCDDTPFLLLKY